MKSDCAADGIVSIIDSFPTILPFTVIGIGRSLSIPSVFLQSIIHPKKWQKSS